MKNKVISTTLIAILVISISSSLILNSNNDVLAKKGCEAKQWSDCKGTKGWYTKEGHHHCVKDVDKGCILTKGHHYKN